MMWLSWRQFRLQALVGLVVLVVVAAYLLSLGLEIGDAFEAAQARCQTGGDCAQAMNQFRTEYENLLLFLAAGFGVLPALVGAFWGAPLVARELESGTHRLVWNQSVTRRRWFIVKLLVVVLSGMVVAGVFSALLTWAAGPVDQVADWRFGTIMFGARNLAPLGYAAFGITLGVVMGLLTRRTLPAMALTLLAVVVVQFAVPNLVRPHLMPPEEFTMPMTAEAINQARGLGSITGAAVVKGLTVPDAWVTEVSELRTEDGRALARATFDECFHNPPSTNPPSTNPPSTNPPSTGATGTFGDAAVCLGALDLHVDLAYQPNHRYWPFQLLETGLYLALSALLAVIGGWRIRRRLS